MSPVVDTLYCFVTVRIISDYNWWAAPIKATTYQEV